MLFQQFEAQAGYDLWLLTDSGETVPVLATTPNEATGVIAPGGRWIAYQSDESGRPEIYVCEIPGAESRRRVSIDGGTHPRWNPNGQELFYRNDSKLMVVDVDIGERLVLARPRILFEANAYFPSTNASNYDVGADGEGFVMIVLDEAAQSPTELVLVQNWTEELKRLVPTGN